MTVTGEQFKDNQHEDCGEDIDKDGYRHGSGDGQDNDDSKSGETSQSAPDGQDDGIDIGSGGHESWKLNQPHPLPLTFRVPTSATTWKTERLEKKVDFTSQASVTAANKAARQRIHRARNALGLPPLRPSTKGREYDQGRDDAIEALYIDHAEENDGARIGYPQLTENYNKLFPGDIRSRGSISAHVEKTPQLKAVRDKYQKP